MPLKKLISCFLLLVAGAWIVSVSAQVRGARRTAVVRDGEGHGAAVGPRGAAVKTEEGYAAAGRHGAVVKGDEGYAAVGRHGAVAATENGYARVGPRGAVVAGEEGYAAVGRHGVVVGNHYESYDAWRAVAGVGGQTVEAADRRDDEGRAQRFHETLGRGVEVVGSRSHVDDGEPP